MKRLIKLWFRKFFKRRFGIPWLHHSQYDNLRMQAEILYRAGYHRAAAMTARVGLEKRLKHKARCVIASRTPLVKHPRSGLAAIYFLMEESVITHEEAKAYRRAYGTLSKSAHGYSVSRQKIGETIDEVDRMSRELMHRPLPVAPKSDPLKLIASPLAESVGVA